MGNELTQYLPAARLARYGEACAGTQVAPLDLYQWASTVALAAFEDVSHLEVVLRSRMGEALASQYGLRWFQRADLFDDDTLRLISTAWTQGGLTALVAQGAEDHVVHGKLIASLMFGFWVKLLGRGSHQGKAPFRSRRIYDTTLWRPALSQAFQAAPDRTSTERTAHRVQALRNRVAHHEHIIWGVPVAGASRLTLAEAHTEVLTLARHLDPAFHDWMTANSRVTALVADAPLPGPWTRS